MKAGDVISKSYLIQAGFHQVDWFAGYMVFKKFIEKTEDYIYIFYDPWEKKIKSTLITKQ